MDAAESVPLPVPSDGFAFAAWTLGQAAVVALYAAGVKLAGGYPVPPEATADLGLAVTQIVLAVALAPALFSGIGRCVRAGAIGMAWTALAACLAGRSFGQVLPVIAVTALWVAAIAGWRRLPAMSLAIAFLTFAGPVLFYVSIEYGPRPIGLGDWPTLLSAPLGVCTTRLHSRAWTPLVPPLVALVAAFAGRFGKRTHHRPG